MERKVWYFCKDDSKALEDIGVTLGYYASNFKGEIERWFSVERFDGNKWIEYSEEDKYFRFDLCCLGVGPEFARQLRDLRSLTLEELVEVVGKSFDLLEAFIDSPNYCSMTSTHEMPPARRPDCIEDLYFYCGEVLRGIESAFRFDQVRLAYEDEEITGYRSMRELLVDTVGTVEKEEICDICGGPKSQCFGCDEYEV